MIFMKVLFCFYYVGDGNIWHGWKGRGKAGFRAQVCCPKGGNGKRTL